MFRPVVPQASYRPSYHPLCGRYFRSSGVSAPCDVPGNWYPITQILRLSVAKFRAAAPRISFMSRKDPRGPLASLPPTLAAFSRMCLCEKCRQETFPRSARAFAQWESFMFMEADQVRRPPL
jgi:hypothetical protein